MLRNTAVSASVATLLIIFRLVVPVAPPIIRSDCGSCNSRPRSVGRPAVPLRTSPLRSSEKFAMARSHADNTASKCYGPSGAGPLDRGNGLFTYVLGNQAAPTTGSFFSQLLST